MKYIKLLLVFFQIVIAVSVIMGYQNNTSIMLLILALLNAINGWECYHKNKRDSVILFLTALFAGFVSIFIMFS